MRQTAEILGGCGIDVPVLCGLTLHEHQHQGRGSLETRLMLKEGWQLGQNTWSVGRGAGPNPSRPAGVGDQAGSIQRQREKWENVPNVHFLPPALSLPDLPESTPQPWEVGTIISTSEAGKLRPRAQTEAGCRRSGWETAVI